MGRDGSAPRTDSGPVVRRDGSVEPPPGAVVCGAHVCAAGQACCLFSLECFDPTDTAACMLPADVGDPGACVSNADCRDGQICENSDIFSPDSIPGPACGGTVGHCVMIRGPDLCGGFGDGVCGCDGRTYRDPCEASRAGVRVSWMFPCGAASSDTSVYDCDAEHSHCPEGSTCDFAAGRCRDDHPFIACGIDEQCPLDHYCCGIVGACMRDDCPDCCFVPPTGTWYPCLRNEDCRDPYSGFERGPSRFYCDYGSPACGGEGGCRDRMSSCGGELVPVCGCDGTSYSNACWASEAGVSIASNGACP